ncbi:MAG: hypothetical protein DDT40_01908 [candidate division WS2 bacterium]|nr:hypothetical protein [Candidatus Psychracetigena formicireducens]
MLTQSEADALIDLQKKRAEKEVYNFPLPGKILIIPITSMDERESFLIDINRGSIRLTKCTYQERYQRIIILARLDVDGPPHSNPEVMNVPFSYLAPYNGQTIFCPHLHLYVEGFMDKWAVPAPSDKFPITEDIGVTLDDFFRYCNVIEPPLVQRSLF